MPAEEQQYLITQSDEPSTALDKMYNPSLLPEPHQLQKIEFTSTYSANSPPNTGSR
jgi:hypothetical protein